MPTVFREAGYRFFFYSDEGEPREPAHVHVAAGDKIAKIWVDPVELARSKRMKAHEIKEILTLVEKHGERIREAWNAHFEL